MHENVQNDTTFYRTFEDTKAGDKKDAFDVSIDGALEGAFANAI